MIGAAPGVLPRENAGRSAWMSAATADAEDRRMILLAAIEGVPRAAAFNKHIASSTLRMCVCFRCQTIY